MSPKVSVIVPVYNAARFLNETINSILDQTYASIELILVDDGSTDDSRNIINRYSDHNNVKIIFDENHGAPYARNHGCEVAEGEYVIWFDADDLMYPTLVEKLVNGIEISRADLSMCGNDIIDENGKLLKPSVTTGDARVFNTCDKNNLRELLDTIPFPDSKLFRMSVIRDNDLHFSDVRIGQDLNFYIKYLSVANTVWKTNLPLCGYRMVGGSISHSYNSKKIFDIVKSIDDAEQYVVLKTKQKILLNEFCNIRVRHYYLQSQKYIMIDTWKDRLNFLGFFAKRIISIGNDESQDLSEYYGSLVKKMKIKWRFRYFFTCPFWTKYKKRRREKF